MAKNLTHGRPSTLLLRFTIPLLIGNIFQQVLNIADTLIVGRVYGVEALAAVGATGPVVFFVLGFAQGTTGGLAIPLAQRFGAGDSDGVRKSFATSIVIGLVMSAIITAITTPFTRPILQLMQTPANIIDQAAAYMGPMFAGTFAVVFYNLFANTIRSLGDSTTPLYFLVLAVIANVGLDLLFMVTFDMGVAGAAYATVLSLILATVASGGLIAWKMPQLHAHRADFHPSRSSVSKHLRIGLPMGFQASIIAIGMVLIQVALNQLGSTAVAAYTAAQKIEMFALMPFVSFGVAMGTYTAQNFGAFKQERIWKGARAASLMSGAYGILIAAVILLGNSLLIRAFVGAGHAEVERLSFIYFIWSAPFYTFLVLLFIFRYTLQGLGHSLVPTIAGILELAMRVATAIWIAPTFGFEGVALSNPLAWIAAFVLLAWAYFTEKRPYSGKHSTYPSRRRAEADA